MVSDNCMWRLADDWPTHPDSVTLVVELPRDNRGIHDVAVTLPLATPPPFAPVFTPSAAPPRPTVGIVALAVRFLTARVEVPVAFVLASLFSLAVTVMHLAVLAWFL
jgi:hypothetical protein